MSEQSCCGCAGDSNKTPAFAPSNTSPENNTHLGGGSFVSEFMVSKMDCPSEERIIRMALENLEPAVAFNFDIPNRKVWIFHSGNIEDITQRMVGLGLGAHLEKTEATAPEQHEALITNAQALDVSEATTLKLLLAINAFMFVLELAVGWWAQSTGLIADSLDMFADAAVYGVALYAVGRSAKLKLRSARLAGCLQLLLALGALAEVLRRFVFGSEPLSNLMMGFGFIALVANVTCLMLIAKNRDGGVHMKASYIFSANDVVANAGVILAGLLVAVSGSRYPDLMIGLFIALVVLNGARRILQLKA